MSWEMQCHMVGYIIPSILAHISAYSEDEQFEWVATRLGDDTFEKTEGEHAGWTTENWLPEVRRFGLQWGVEAVAAIAERIASTNNGGHEFYVDEDGWCTVPWCSDEDMLCYHS